MTLQILPVGTLGMGDVVTVVNQLVDAYHGLAAHMVAFDRQLTSDSEYEEERNLRLAVNNRLREQLDRKSVKVRNLRRHLKDANRALTERNETIRSQTVALGAWRRDYRDAQQMLGAGPGETVAMAADRVGTNLRQARNLINALEAKVDRSLKRERELQTRVDSLTASDLERGVAG